MSKRWPTKTVIGLTGNIATGKSAVRRMLEALEAFGVDADGLAHRAMSPGAPAYEPVVETFGKFILAPDGQIDRSKLGKIVFMDPEALGRLEAITHPIVKQAVDLLIRRSHQNLVAIEAIKLFESSMAADCDAVWVIDAPESVQLSRLMESRKLPEAEARMRISAQSSQSEKLARANVIIYNGGGYESTFEQVEKHLAELTGKKVVEEAPPVEVEVTPPPPAEVQPEPIPAEAPIAVRRGGPRDAESIAGFINLIKGTSLARADIMLRFGQKAYMMAEARNRLIGVSGWQVENLITRIDELILAPDAPVEKTISALVDSIEKASNDLQSEISLLFVQQGAADDVRRAVTAKGYEQQDAASLRVPDWREAAEDSAPPDSFLNVKRLREDRVLKPI